ncbi:MAG: hypothetical protein KDB63_15310 [Nocardioidaceae bacterium]|nr:hypothetical protein [Nocardioidaceae bacterium]
MTPQHLAPMVLLVASLSLAGCSPSTPVAVSTPVAADDPTGAPTVATTPHWPADCEAHSGTAIDYGDDATGPPTRKEAILAEAPGDGYRLVRVPPEPHRQPAWWIVDVETNEIYAQVTAWKGDHGWLVDGVETCA